MEQLFAGTGLFKRLTPAQRKRLVSASREKRYAKGETVFRAGDPAEAVCIVNVLFEGCNCLDEVAWRHGMDAKTLVEELQHAAEETALQEPAVVS